MKNLVTQMRPTGLCSLTPHGPCIHVQNGKGSAAKNCIHGYECRHCAYDQWIDAMEAGEKSGSSLKAG